MPSHLRDLSNRLLNTSGPIDGTSRSPENTASARDEAPEAPALRPVTDSYAPVAVATSGATPVAPSAPGKPTCIGGVQHAPVRLQDIAAGDLCFQVASHWHKSPTHHLINTVQRLHSGAVMGLPGLRSGARSVTVVHTAIVVRTDPAAGTLTLAESTPPGGLHTLALDFRDPKNPDSNVDARCDYVFYRMRCPEEAALMADIAQAWVRYKADYSNLGAGLAALMPNRPHYYSRCDLVQLALLAGEGSTRPWPDNAMICSQFVARVWGAIAAARAVKVARHEGRPASQRALRHAAAEGFPCSTWNVLPARLHSAVAAHADFASVGALNPRRRNEG